MMMMMMMIMEEGAPEDGIDIDQDPEYFGIPSHADENAVANERI